MKKLVPVIFIVAIAALAVAYLRRNAPEEAEEAGAVARVVIPQVRDEIPEDGAVAPSTYSEASLVSFIPLNGDETLIRTESVDFDGDGYDDQVNAIKTAISPYLQLLVGLYNPATRSYERVGTIATPVTQVKTFSYTGMDLVGDHRTALVYQGFGPTGNSILQAYFLSRDEEGRFRLRPIANLEGDGTIFVQEMERSDAYNQSGANGASFPIWVYSSDSSRPNSTDQLHTRYDWDPGTQRYEQTSQQRITGSHIAASELARIQDGTVDTFAAFLNGMWYRTEGRDIYYLFFDWASRQIVFFVEARAEVFNWQNANVRRNGMYITSTNLEIENLRRNIDITLRNVDEISVRVQDDVRMLVSEASHWNGSYAKVSATTFRSEGEAAVPQDRAIVSDLESGPQWKASDGTVMLFVDGQYSLTSDSGMDYGSYASMLVEGRPYIQFRSDTDNAFFGKMYLLGYAPLGEDGGESNPDSVIMQPFLLAPNRAYAEDDKMVILTRYDPAALEAEEGVQALEGELAFTVDTTDDGPKVSVDSSANPYLGRYFSPDNDGNEDVLTMTLGCETRHRIRSWSLVVRDSRSGGVFWRTGGSSMPAAAGKDGAFATTITWNGRGTNGSTVTSAEDYPYEFTVTDDQGLTGTYTSIIPVDVLVVREGGRLKMQVPSIVFRADAADFKLLGEYNADGTRVMRSTVTREQKASNERVLSRIAQILRKFSSYRVTIVGHANPTNVFDGPEANNPEETQDGVWGRALIPLSRERAQYIKDWLVSEGGIASGRLSVEGKGGLETIVDKTDLNIRWRNRRVEFILER